MNNKWINYITSLKIMVLLLCFSPVIVYSAEKYIEGINYTIIPVPLDVPLKNPNNISVIEFFWYGCVHCYKLETYLHPWIKKLPSNVEFIKVPALFGGNWVFHGRVYLALEEMQADPSIHADIFDEIHVNNNRLSTESSIKSFLKEKGVPTNEFFAKFNSIDVVRKMQLYKKIIIQSATDGVPALVVNNKYYINGRLAGSMENMLDIADYLIKKESK